MSQLFANNAISTLSAAITTSGQASIVLQTGHGARFPSPTVDSPFFLTLDDGTNVEICKCTARSTDTLTIARAQENTTAQSAFAATATKVELRLTAAALTRFETFINNNAPRYDAM